jgi:hypothetical protein
MIGIGASIRHASRTNAFRAARRHLAIYQRAGGICSATVIPLEMVQPQHEIPVTVHVSENQHLILKRRTPDRRDPGVISKLDISRHRGRINVLRITRLRTASRVIPQCPIADAPTVGSDHLGRPSRAYSAGKRIGICVPNRRRPGLCCNRPSHDPTHGYRRRVGALCQNCGIRGLR